MAILKRRTSTKVEPKKKKSPSTAKKKTTASYPKNQWTRLQTAEGWSRDQEKSCA